MRRDTAEDIFIESFAKYKNHNAKILLSMYQGNYHKFLLSAIFYTIKHSPAWVMPIVIANIVNCVTAREAASVDIIALNAAVVAALVILNIPMNYLHVHYRSRAIRHVEAGLRSALVRKLQQLSISYHKEMQSGRLQSKVMRDVEAVENLSAQLFVNLLNILINILVALGITAFHNLIVFIFFLLTIPVAAITIVAFRNRIKKQNHRFRKEMEATSARVMEMEEMVPVTRAHALENIEVRKMEALVRSIAEEGYRLDIIQANFGSVSWAVFQIFQVGCLIFTGMLVLKDKLLAGDIILFQSYFTTIVTQVSGLLTLLPAIAKGMESITSIGEVLNAHDIEEHSGKPKLQSLKGDYEFNNLGFHYNDAANHILSGLSMRVRAGQTIALVGESGAGKSTILNLVIGFILPSEGELLIDGNDLKEINLRSYRKHIAVVPQETILFSGSVRDNITYGLPSVTEEQLEEAVRAANLTDVVKSLPEGLDTLIGDHGNKLSGGQRQRIAIARAIIRNPRVIIFDEATSALDSVSEALILEALSNLIKGRTTFIVAHRLSTIRKADKICVLRDGTCTEFGTYEELMALRGEFYRMKSLQS